MSYHLDKQMWGRVFAVPTQVVDKHLKLCGELPLKVLLLLLRWEDPLDLQQIQDRLGGKYALADIEDAVQYWVDQGILYTGSVTAQELQPVAVEARASETARVSGMDDAAYAPRLLYEAVLAEEMTVKEPERKVKIMSDKRMRLHTQEINQMAAQDENISYLLQEAQVVLNKPLNAVSTDTVVALYSYYSMAPDMILMLLQYCVAVGKDSMQYVEKVAAGWLEQGIDTHEKAEETISRAIKQRSLEGRIKAAFGIYDRKLVAKEQKYIEDWTGFGYDLDIITMAFERCVELKGKLSFAYINGILKNWHQKGIKTPQEAAKEFQAQGKEHRVQPDASDRNASYEISELEQMIRNKRVLE